MPENSTNSPRPKRHLCPYCQKWGVKTVLTPIGKKLECINCGNVYWASDPMGAKSTAPVPFQSSLTLAERRGI